MATKTKKPSINLGGLTRPNRSFSGIGIPDFTQEEAETLRAKIAETAKAPEKAADKAAEEIIKGYENRTLVKIEQLENAPDEWNFFTKPDKANLIELAVSIYNNGLLQPIAVRALDAENTKFQILAGHSRAAAFALLKQVYNDPKFDEIEALVFGYGKIDDDQAKEIIIDTNFVQRGRLSPSDMSRSIIEKIKLLKARNTEDVIGKIAAEYEIKQTSVYMWRKLSNLIEPFAKMMNEKAITLESAYKLANFSAEDQAKIYENAKDEINNHSISRIKKDMTADKAIEVIKADRQIKVKHTRFTYTSDMVKNDSDVAKLVFIEKGKEAEFKELLQSLGYAYIID